MILRRSSTLNEVEWRDIPGYEGSYQASSDGRIRSLTRQSIRADGIIRTVQGKELKRYPVGEYLCVNLSVDGKRTQITVHKLVLLAFKGELPAGQERLHGIGGSFDNSIENLRYGTRGENVADKAKHRAIQRNVGNTCSKGHNLLDDGNVAYWGSNRRCLACERGERPNRELPDRL